MFQIAKPIFLICETPLHAGAGTGIGTELPIQREEHTRFPKVESSGLKGAFREVFGAKKHKIGLNPDMIAVFGHPDKGDEQAGSLGLTDARLLLFPVRSRRAVFAWVTCPRVLKRFTRDLEVSKANGGESQIGGLLGAVSAAMNFQKAAVVETGSVIEKEGKIMLEEYVFEVDKKPEATQLANCLKAILEIEDLPAQFAIIPDDSFSDFVEQCTEHQTRIKIGENGVVETGALFTEEHLPAESVLYSLVLAQPELKKDGKTGVEILDFFEKGLPDIVQIGGNATLGKGIVRIAKTFLQP